jgi:sugar-specific transcriptional regulator TrmB
MQTTSKPLEQTLKNIGFEDKEAKIYLALLQLGPSDAKAISLKSGIKKPTTYVILESLRQKNAVLFLPNAKKKLFAAKKPDEIFEEANKRIHSAFSQLPLLNALSRNSKEKAMVTYYEGKAGYAQAMQYKQDEVIRIGELPCYFAAALNIDPDILIAVDKYLNHLKKNKVHLRGFAPEHETIHFYQSKDPEFLSDIKILPYDVYSGKSSIEISETFVRFTLFEEQMFVIIDNTEIAKIMKQIFEMNWRAH